MFEDMNKGLAFVIIVFILGGIAVLIAGIIGIASPGTVIGIAKGLGLGGILNSLPIINSMLGIGLFDQPLLSNLPLIGALSSNALALPPPDTDSKPDLSARYSFLINSYSLSEIACFSFSRSARS